MGPVGRLRKGSRRSRIRMFAGARLGRVIVGWLCEGGGLSKQAGARVGLPAGERQGGQLTPDALVVDGSAIMGVATIIWRQFVKTRAGEDPLPAAPIRIKLRVDDKGASFAS